MALLVRPEPFSTEFNRLFNSLWDQSVASSQRWVPEMDLVETEDHYLLKADLPGMKQSDVSIEWGDGTLTISGERKAEYERKEKGFFRLERSFGKFSRSLTLPEGIDPDKIQAAFTDGVLEVTIPKPEERKPRRIEVGWHGNGNGQPKTIEGTSTTES
ncbi:MAG TPA: Hsp20/alpha crystallin family protein [Thermoleophilaceae bacterium]|nr:Hsp20/alpha crystallin family protein [Thermoleophilaceae bacterium]